ncbi:hypothetical protein CBR_g26243 [Chara braunii]|uniref:Uncharacterized protein n=1 Tax=Chara braunii TaxID=69332 RepID=A0A388L7B6_CHABU|nr:hypothetical protein CBR_g26243 [Chara braunii]|eukprot:GBG78210.1 hypothetical protein CBR_g26243 [Chara braunii]
MGKPASSSWIYSLYAKSNCSNCQIISLLVLTFVGLLVYFLGMPLIWGMSAKGLLRSSRTLIRQSLGVQEVDPTRRPFGPDYRAEDLTLAAWVKERIHAGEIKAVETSNTGSAEGGGDGGDGTQPTIVQPDGDVQQFEVPQPQNSVFIQDWRGGLGGGDGDNNLKKRRRKRRRKKKKKKGFLN